MVPITKLSTIALTLALLGATGSATEEVVWVTNPTSGVELFCHIHRPVRGDK